MKKILILAFSFYSVFIFFNSVTWASKFDFSQEKALQSHAQLLNPQFRTNAENFVRDFSKDQITLIYQDGLCYIDQEKDLQCYFLNTRLFDRDGYPELDYQGLIDQGYIHHETIEGDFKSLYGNKGDVCLLSDQGRAHCFSIKLKNPFGNSYIDVEDSLDVLQVPQGKYLKLTSPARGYFNGAFLCGLNHQRNIQCWLNLETANQLEPATLMKHVYEQDLQEGEYYVDLNLYYNKDIANSGVKTNLCALTNFDQTHCWNMAFNPDLNLRAYNAHLYLGSHFYPVQFLNRDIDIRQKAQTLFPGFYIINQAFWRESLPLQCTMAFTGEVECSLYHDEFSVINWIVDFSLFEIDENNNGDWNKVQIPSRFSYFNVSPSGYVCGIGRDRHEVYCDGTLTDQLAHYFDEGIQLMDEDFFPTRERPFRSNTPFIDIESSPNQVCALTENRVPWCFGYDGNLLTNVIISHIQGRVHFD